MFCKNCGKKIPENVRFCNYCGADQNNGSTQNTQSTNQTNGAQWSSGYSQPVYTENRSQKTKKKGPFKIIISIVAAAVAYVIGYFVIGANMVKPPTPFDEPKKRELEEFEMPKIKENIANDDINEVGVLEEKAFRFKNEAADMWVTFYYTEDGTVENVSGAHAVYDLSLTEVVDSLRSDAENVQAMLAEMGIENGSEVTMEELPDKFYVSYNFFGLLNNSDMAEVAAAFVGVETENGKIMITTAEEDMIGFGFTHD